MKLADMIAAFRVETDDLAAGEFAKDESITRWLNEAEDEACMRKNLLFESAGSMCQVAVTPAERRYRISDRWVYLTAASLMEPGRSEPAGTLGLRTRSQLDAEDPRWRIEPREPRRLITYDGSVELDGGVLRAMTLQLEGWRLPMRPMGKDGDTPEIGAIHHRFLVFWAMHRVYSIPDSEILNPGAAQAAEAAFTRYFGPRPDADQRREQAADQLHCNRAW